MKIVITLLLILSGASQLQAAPKPPAEYMQGSLINMPACGYLNDPFLELVCDDF
jgi:hypothetical protein